MAHIEPCLGMDVREGIVRDVVVGYWLTARRIFTLIEAVMRDPFSGIGKPELLKYLGVGVWSRRMTQAHRLVYVVSDQRIDCIQARYHY